jgi:hypothetical protein
LAVNFPAFATGTLAGDDAQGCGGDGKLPVGDRNVDTAGRPAASEPDLSTDAPARRDEDDGLAPDVLALF